MSKDREHLAMLEDELERAHIASAAQVPADVITMNSKARMTDPSETRSDVCLKEAQSCDCAQYRPVRPPCSIAQCLRRALKARHGVNDETQIEGALRLR